MPSSQRVLVTGGSGFIAGHVILRLLEQGYIVRTTIRSLDREPDVRRVLSDAGMINADQLSFVAADLTADDGWAEAVADCGYVQHVASPVQPGHVKNPDDLIIPAREGTLRVLRAAQAAGVRRLVLTSAFHAVGFGHRHDHPEFTEEDWSVIDGPGVDAYGKSKIMAERAAWDFVAGEDNALELTTMLPVAVMGPVLGRAVSGSNHLVQQMLAGQLPGYPNLYIPVVDVRDVAAAHVAAMAAPEAAGQRFLIASGEPAIALREIGAILRDQLGDPARRVPTRTIPDLVVRIAALFSAQYRPVAADLGFVKRVSITKAQSLLGFDPRPSREAIVAAGESMIAKSLITT